MTSSTKGYLILAGIVLYHVAALYGIMLLFDLHIGAVSLAALAWLISLPITFWKGVQYANKKSDGLSEDITKLFDNDSKE